MGFLAIERLTVHQVESKLFRLPRRAFENNSEIFKDLRKLPSSPDQPEDGSSDEHPLRLEGIESHEFTQLLRVMFPRYDIALGAKI
jgi:hypothetical protein